MKLADEARWESPGVGDKYERWSRGRLYVGKVPVGMSLTVTNGR
ncbi:hypothetical protein LY41_001883 [Prauserella halophila]|nr:hypothetical protein [Prauserella halophila]